MADGELWSAKWRARSGETGQRNGCVSCMVVAAWINPRDEKLGSVERWLGWSACLVISLPAGVLRKSAQRWRQRMRGMFRAKHQEPRVVWLAVSELQLAGQRRSHCLGDISAGGLTEMERWALGG